MIHFWRNKTIFIVILTLLVVSAGLYLVIQYFRTNQELSLVIEDPRTGTEYYSLSVKPGDRFTLTCRNSVSKSLVKGNFMINDQRQIQPLTTSFTSYGPGLPFDFMEEYQIKEGIITVFHNELPREELRLWVTPLTEEMVTFNNRDYPLGSLTETNLLLTIFVEKENY
jgi:hypothetical protein